MTVEIEKALQAREVALAGRPLARPDKRRGSRAHRDAGDGLVVTGPGGTALDAGGVRSMCFVRSDSMLTFLDREPQLPFRVK
jgi:hypothetical protein